MKNVKKSSVVSLSIFLSILFIAILYSPLAIAQNNFQSPIWFNPAFSSQPLAVPALSPTTGDLLIDNFEYWDSPYNHGWSQVEPPYPVYGYGLGYATRFNTVLDLQEGSRVLDVYRPSSVFLIGTPYARHAIRYPCNNCLRLNLNPNTGGWPIISFKFRAPLGIDPWDIFKLRLYTGCPATNYIDIVPLHNACLNYSFSPQCSGAPYIATPDNQGNWTITIGRDFLDGSWHVAWIDLYALTQGTITTIDSIEASGQMFRMDDIAFRKSFGHEHLDYPDMFEMGPLYAQIFEPYRYLFIVDYAGAKITHQNPHDPNDLADFDAVTHLLLHPAAFFTTPNEIWGAWIQDLAGSDPNLSDPNYLSANYNDPNNHFLQRASSTARNLIGNPGFLLDARLPVFSDANMRLGKFKALNMINQGALAWNATIGGSGANGIQSNLLQPLPINPYDGMPTYLPAYYTSIDAIELYGQASFDPDLVLTLESALWNIGMPIWPNIVYMDYTPQTFEDLIVTLEVTNGAHSDVRTFPISVVNYPVENYPPVLQLDIDDQLFYVDDSTPHANEYVMNFVDPDCYIFSLASFITGEMPATSHVPRIPGLPAIRTDQATLTFSASLAGYASYQYGPWMQSIINPKSGLIHFTPKFEGAYNIVVTCTDSQGASAVGEVTIFCVTSGTWLNHPPIVLGGPTQPVTLRAGEEFILHAPNFAVEDPDGDIVYSSCNIGSCGKDPSGDFIWTFQSNFPGQYLIEIIFYDIRGGYGIMEFFVDVKPWWSF